MSHIWLYTLFVVSLVRRRSPQASINRPFILSTSSGRTDNVKKRWTCDTRTSLVFVGHAAGAAFVETCREKPLQEKAPCYQSRLEEMLKAQGTEQALTALEQLAAQDPDVLREAHPYTHHVGRFSFSHCRDTFWSGCYHGVLEGYLHSLPRMEPRAIAILCSEKNIDARQSWFLKYQCVHGLGHGLTLYFQYYFQYDVLRALIFCGALPTDWDRESCYGGVYGKHRGVPEAPLRAPSGPHGLSQPAGSLVPV